MRLFRRATIIFSMSQVAHPSMPRFRVRLGKLAPNIQQTTSSFSFDDPDYQDIRYKLVVQRGSELSSELEYLWSADLHVSSLDTDIDIVSLTLVGSCDEDDSISFVCQANGQLPRLVLVCEPNQGSFSFAARPTSYVTFEIQRIRIVEATLD